MAILQVLRVDGAKVETKAASCVNVFLQSVVAVFVYLLFVHKDSGSPILHETTNDEPDDPKVPYNNLQNVAIYIPLKSTQAVLGAYGYQTSQKTHETCEIDDSGKIPEAVTVDNIVLEEIVKALVTVDDHDAAIETEKDPLLGDLKDSNEVKG